MNQRAIAYAAVIMSLLVVVAGIGIATDPGLEVASRHTSASDFDAGSHTNTTVVTVGGASDVRLPDFNDTFESESADSGVPDNWTVGNAPTSVNVTTVHAVAGSQSMGVDGTDLGTIVPSRHPNTDTVTANISVSIYAEGGNAQVFVDGAKRIIIVGMRNGDLIYRNTSGYQTLDAAVTNDEWVNITIFNINPSADTFSVTWESPSSSGTAHDLEFRNTGTGEGWNETQLYTDGDVAFYDNFDVEMQDDGTYISTNHSASQIEQAWTNLSLRNTQATVTWEYWDGSTWNQADQSTYTNGGNQTVDVTGHASAEKWRVNVTFSPTGSNPNARVHDEGVLFNASTPTQDNSSASPTGDLSSSDVTLSIDINDSDFATPQGDSVNVSFYTNRSGFVGSDVLTSNGTATTSHSFTTGGDTRWWVELSDDYGETNRSANFTVTTPGQLTIRNETSPHGIVSQVSVTVKFFEDKDDDPTIIERSSSNGQIDLTGLPVGSEFAVTIKADGYHNRTVRLDDIFQQQNVFILNKSRPSIENTFVVEDKTGNYPSSETRIIIQKAINRSEYGGSPAEFTWTVMAADELGADDSFTVDLEQGDRYRIIVENGQGDQRILGSYDAENGGIVTLTIGEIEVGAVDPEKGYAWEAVFTNESGTGPQATFKFSDKNSSTTSLTLVIFEYGNESNEVYNQTHSGPFGEFKVTTSLPNSTRWVVQFEATRAGETITGKRIIGPNSGYINIGLSQVWKNLASVGLLIVIGGLFGGIRAELGAVIVALMGGILWFVGWLPPAAGGGAVVLALGVSVLMMVRGD